MRSYHSPLVLSCLLLHLFAHIAEAAIPQLVDDAAGAEMVVGVALDAAQQSDWTRFAKHMHPAGLKDFRNTVLPVLKRATEKDVDDARKAAAHAVLDAFGIQNARDLEPLALEPDAFFAGVLEAAKFQAKQQLVADADYRIIGTVFEGKNLAHVVVKAQRELKGVNLSSMEVFSLKRRGGEWRIATSTALQGTLAIFKLVQIK